MNLREWWRGDAILDTVEGELSLFPGEETVDWVALEEDRLWFVEVWGS